MAIIENKLILQLSGCFAAQFAQIVAIFDEYYTNWNLAFFWKIGEIICTLHPTIRVYVLKEKKYENSNDF